MISNDDIRQIFFYCEHKSRDGVYADNVDILEFGRKIAEVAFLKGQDAERAGCIAFVKPLNKEVAKALEHRSAE